MKSNVKLLLVIIFYTLIFYSCKKDNEVAKSPEEDSLAINFNLNYNVDNDLLEFNSIKYINLSGNHFSVTTLRFYLSEICLLTEDSQKVFIKDYVYADASVPTVISIPHTSVSKGNYIGLCFNIGLDSMHNITGGLPSTLDNLSMEWPDVMGGGYHFLKLEGYYSDSSETPGYAIHLGTNMSLCAITLYHSISISNKTLTKTLSMNVNEFFKDPFSYNFKVDGNYTMGNMMAMYKISSNAYNVFTLE